MAKVVHLDAYEVGKVLEAVEGALALFEALRTAGIEPRGPRTVQEGLQNATAILKGARA